MKVDDTRSPTAVIVYRQRPVLVPCRDWPGLDCLWRSIHFLGGGYVLRQRLLGYGQRQSSFSLCFSLIWEIVQLLFIAGIAVTIGFQNTGRFVRKHVKVSGNFL